MGKVRGVVGWVALGLVGKGICVCVVEVMWQRGLIPDNCLAARCQMLALE